MTWKTEEEYWALMKAYDLRLNALFKQGLKGKPDYVSAELKNILDGMVKDELILKEFAEERYNSFMHKLSRPSEYQRWASDKFIEGKKKIKGWLKGKDDSSLQR